MPHNTLPRRPLALAALRSLACAALLMLTSCASGGRKTPAPPLAVNLDIPTAQLQRRPNTIPDPTGATDPELLANHGLAARMYHGTANQVNALICTLLSQVGVLINGETPKRPTWCDDVRGEQAVQERTP